MSPQEQLRRINEIERLRQAAKEHNANNPLDGWAAAHNIGLKFQQQSQEPQQPQRSFGQKVLDAGTAVSDFIGGKGIADQIGTQIAKIGQPAEVQQQLQSQAPSATETFGSALQVGSLFTPVGTIAGGTARLLGQAGLKTGAKLAGNVTAGATAGLAQDVGSDLQTGQEVSPGLGTALGAAIPVAGAAIGKAAASASKFGEQQINSLIKPLLKDFSYGKNPGRGVAQEGIVANSLEELAQKIGVRRNEIGAEIGTINKHLDDMLASKAQTGVGKLNLVNSLKPIDDAIEQAVVTNNDSLIQRLSKVKQALAYNLTKSVDDKGAVSIAVGDARKLEDLNFADAFNMKKMVGDMTVFTGNPSDDKAVNGALKKVYGSIKGQILDKADEVDPAVAKLLSEKNERYADLTSAEIAAKYRDKIEMRQNIVSAPIKAGAIAGLLAAPFTGGVSLATLLVGLGAAGAEKALSTPAVKTRVAAWLASEAPKVIDDFALKNPEIYSIIQKYVTTPGDMILKTLKKKPKTK